MKRQLPTVKMVKELLFYDAETGLFHAIKQSGPRMPGQLAGTTHSEGYTTIQVAGRLCFAHRLAWFYVHGEWPSGCIDHIDGDRKNNAITNLRVVNQRTNNQNTRRATKKCKVGLLGVTALYGKFRASIGFNGKSIHLGMFDTAEQAHLAYVEKKRELHAGCTL